MLGNFIKKFTRGNFIAHKNFQVSVGALLESLLVSSVTFPCILRLPFLLVAIRVIKKAVAHYHHRRNAPVPGIQRSFKFHHFSYPVSPVASLEIHFPRNYSNPMPSFLLFLPPLRPPSSAAPSFFMGNLLPLIPPTFPSFIFHFISSSFGVEIRRENFLLVSYSLTQRA